MLNVAVFFGGVSCEHDISILTGEQLILNCDREIYNVIPIYIDKSNRWYTGDKLLDIDNIKENLNKCKECTIVPGYNNLYIKKGKILKKINSIDVAILCLHGRNGEDGAIPALMQLSDIPYTSCSMCSSALCLDKSIFKDVCKGIGIDVIEGFSVSENEYFTNKNVVYESILRLGFPVILKPSRLGSSIGIEVCKDSSELEVKLENTFKFDKKVLVEKYISIKKEINIALIDDKGVVKFSKTEEPISKDEILSFNEKYMKNAGGFETIKRKCPAEIDSVLEENIKNIALLCYRRLELFGIVRFDFILDKDDKLYLNEINTIPGSMANYLFDKNEYGYSKLIELMISNAFFRKNKEDEVVKTIDTEVLDGNFEGFKK